MWFIHQSCIDSVIKADGYLTQVEPEKVKAAIEARTLLQQDNGPEIYNVVGTTAEITVSGVLTKTYSYFYGIFGGGSTSYHDIAASIALADADENVEKIELHISSGGGRIDGLTIATNAIRDSAKPIVSIVDGMAASAAYAIAASADEILTTNETDLTGSIGVVQGFYIDPELKEVTNRLSFNKRPDVTTEEGLSAVQDELDPIYDLFAVIISEGRSKATGRDITTDIVASDFGNGAVFIAEAAKKRGMIDGFIDNSGEVVNNQSSNGKTTGSKAVNTKNEKVPDMSLLTLAQLKAEHPNLVAAIVAEETDRCLAHLKGGIAAGMVTQALAAVESGAALTQSAMMDYTLGAQNKAAGVQRSEENPEGGEVAGAAAAEEAAAEKAAAEKAAAGKSDSVEDIDDEVALALLGEEG